MNRLSKDKNCSDRLKEKTSDLKWRTKECKFTKEIQLFD